MISPELPIAEIQSRIERLLFRAVPLWALLLLFLLGAAATIWFGSAVLKPASAGWFGPVATDIASIPQTLHQLFRFGKIRTYYRGDYKPQPLGLWRNRAQPFVDPGYVLLTGYDDAGGRPIIRLVRLRDGHVVRDYAPDLTTINAKSRFTSALVDLKRDRSAKQAQMMHPMLMPDGGLLIHDTSPLARFDACGRMEWMIDGIFHHSAERGADGTIWAAYRYPRSPVPDFAPTFNDEAIAQVSVAGKPLRLARIADILDRNGLGYLWRTRPYTDDPFHLNDVQPVLETGPYWQRGDLFLSLRNLSMILLYRPSTGKILWHGIGPWSFQHDVSILDDHRITIFDNHWRLAAPEGEIDGGNRVPVHDFATGTTSFPYAAATTRFAIRTRAQGRATPLANGDVMLEETERGRLMRVSPDGTLRWRYIAADQLQRRMQLRWSRYLDPTIDGEAIHAAEKATCT